MALYKGSQKVSGSGNSFNPQNAGTTGQVLSKTASGYEWDDAPATGVGSSNNTYEDIIYLSQSDYDALENKDPNTLYSTPDGEGGEPFAPSNAGTTGQVLTKTAGGYDWETPQTITVDSALSDSSENPVQNKVINSALQNLSVASDHLEEKALVGELYTLSDEMFLQNTPALADASIDQNVGDTAANTQIHIQRIASGTASNKLKLKIKKVGTPGDLTVQVMKGISVTVTANVEAYWYGDSNNVLASGTVLASDITTSYQEITVSLGASVGGTKGDLLDIVLSQSSVNSSNYYVIACDSTQWSEGFSFVSVNGDTRTRSKLMPYCVSDGFADSILSKATDDTYDIYEKVGETAYVSGKQSVYVSYGQWGYLNPSSYVYLEPGTYVFKIPDMSGFLLDYYLQNPSPDTNRLTEGIRNYSSGDVILSRGVQGEISAREAEVTITTAGNYGLAFYNIPNGYNSFSAYAPYIPAMPVYSKNSAPKVKSLKEVKVYSQESLGEEIGAYTLGRLPDKSWWDGGILNGVGGLPVEFVEKQSLAIPSDSYHLDLPIFDYDCFLIAKETGSNAINCLFKVYNGSTWIPDSYENWDYKITNIIVTAGQKVRFVRSYNSNQNQDFNLYIYKLNLPS